MASRILGYCVSPQSQNKIQVIEDMQSPVPAKDVWVRICKTLQIVCYQKRQWSVAVLQKTGTARRFHCTRFRPLEIFREVRKISQDPKIWVLHYRIPLNAKPKILKGQDHIVEGRQAVSFLINDLLYMRHKHFEKGCMDRSSYTLLQLALWSWRSHQTQHFSS